MASPTPVTSPSSSPIPSPSPTPLVCAAEGDMWPETPVGTSVIGSCGEGSVEGMSCLPLVVSVGEDEYV